MPTITDWLMVAITLIYAIATFLICHANIKSANASREQLKESQAQYEETKRLTYMPFLQFLEASAEKPNAATDLALAIEEDVDDYFYSVFRLRNIGNGTAINLVYDLKCSSLDEKQIGCIPVNALKPGDEYFWQLSFAIKSETFDSLRPIIIFSYDDILGGSYEQRVYLSFDENSDDLSSVHCDNDNPIYKGVLEYYLAPEEKEKHN